MNRHDVPALGALYADGAVLDSPMFSQVNGRDAIADSFARLFQVFPDYTIRLTEALFVAADDRVAEFSTVSGTQRGEFLGLPATGQQIEYQTARLFTIRQGLIVHERRLYDFRGVLDRLEKARVDRELALASAVQHALCRTRFDGPMCSVVASSLPCRAIGGDFVEYMNLSGGRFGLAVGDVAGKGPAAALVAAMLQGMVSVVAAADDASPTVALERLNAAVVSRDVQPKFATLLYGVLMPDGTFRYSNAGHQPPLLVSGSAVRVLEAGGPFLGAFDDARFPEATVRLDQGDMLVAVSDGVTDTTAPDGSDFGMDRLIDVVSSADRRSAEGMLDGVLQAVHSFAGGVPAVDDVTIAVVRYGRH